MTKLISIHIPKTAGTSFYHILRQVYGDSLSISYKRRDIKGQAPFFDQSEVIHGHFLYEEVASLHLQSQAQVICWLRHPVERVISNYHFFIQGLQSPDRNPEQYELNKHRISESLLTYAQRKENRNRMHKFLQGISLKDMFFIGFVEQFETDINQIAKMLNWPKVSIPVMNKGKSIVTDPHIRQQILTLNHLDWELYQQAKRL
jgi:hypothetical protein